MNHISRTDEEIYKLSGINLVYLGPTVYGIIRDIGAPQPDPIVIKPRPTSNLPKRAGKTMCRDSCHGRARSSSKSRSNIEQQKSTHTDRPQTLSESRRVNFGISAMNITTRKVQSSRQTIDYVSLNDGYDEEDEPQAKKKTVPGSTPSAT